MCYCVVKKFDKVGGNMKLKKIRESKNMTQDKLASALGISRAAVAMWESGAAKPRADKLVKLVEILGCTVDELLRDNG